MKPLYVLFLLFVCGIVVSGCAAVQLGSVPKPPDTSKLRVAVVIISGHGSRGGWGVSADDFVSKQYRATRKLLDRLGYYEVVPEEELQAVLAGFEPNVWNMTRNNAELSYRVGRALYADYVLLVERGAAVGGDPHYYAELILINCETGKEIGVRLENDRRKNHYKLPPDIWRVAYSQLFRDAKGDLLATALRKSSGVQQLKDAQRQAEFERKSAADAERLRAQQKAEGERQERERLARVKVEEEKLAASGVVATGSRVVDYAAAEQEEQRQIRNGKRLIVYDLAAGSEPFRPVALILSEALREEIMRRGIYNLVNRENLQQLLNEMKFQQSGLVDSSQAVQLGKGAGAQEIVTGSLGAVGRTVVLQSKRTDIQSMQNLALASLKSEAGQEDLLLAQLSEMVDRLFQQR